MVAGILSLITFFIDTTIILNLILALVLFGISIFQCTVSFFQELETHQLLKSLKNLIPTDDCLVLRNGEFTNKAVVNLVPGDIVKVKYG
jgi:magnesium-transporting ATPase (P-type)